MQKIHTILLVDDDDASNLKNKELLEKLDIVGHVEVRRDGKEALDYLDSADKEGKFPGLILLDLSMPKISGQQFLAMFNKRYAEKKSCTLICMVSATATVEQRQQILRHYNIPLFIEKPITSKILRDIHNVMVKMDCV